MMRTSQEVRSELQKRGSIHLYLWNTVKKVIFTGKHLIELKNG